MEAVGLADGDGTELHTHASVGGWFQSTGSIEQAALPEKPEQVVLSLAGVPSK